MKRFLCLLMGCLLLFGTAAQGEDFRPLPDCLHFDMAIGEKEPLDHNTYLRRSYPHTCQPAVDSEIAALVDSLAQNAQKPGSCKTEGYLDVTCRVSRSGTGAMSFLLLAATVEDAVQTHVALESRVYDMESGERLRLSHLYRQTPECRTLLTDAIRAQLSAYYPDLIPDEAALEALLTPDALEQAAFSLTPVQLELHYPASLLYPGRETVMHVRILHRALRPHMTKQGRKLTDNSGYQLAALTYDDGPVRKTTPKLLDVLMAHGANATFFVVGTRLSGHRDVLCRQQDSGFSVASHNFQHTYDVTDAVRLRNWKQRFDQELSQITGTVPTIMRAPGGKIGKFQRAQVGLPLIQWDVLSGDSTNDNSLAKVQAIASRVKKNTTAGSVVLLHDMNYQSPLYTEEFLAGLEEKSILLVTVEELFAHYGITLEADTPYYTCTGLTPPVQ